VRPSEAQVRVLETYAAYEPDHCDLTTGPTRTEAALAKRGLLHIESNRGWTLLYITPAGREALAAAKEEGSRCL